MTTQISNRFASIAAEVDEAAESTHAEAVAATVEVDELAQLGPCERALVEAGGDITVEITDLSLPAFPGSDNINQYSAVVDADTGYAFNVGVSDRYATPQHREVARMLDAAVGESDYEVSCKTANRAGQVWWEAKVADLDAERDLDADTLQRAREAVERSSFRVSGLDMDVSLLASHSVDGKSLSYGFKTRVKVCDNGMRTTLDGFSGTFRHTLSLPERIDRLTRIFEAAPQNAISIFETLSRTATSKVADEQVEEFMDQVFGEPETTYRRNQREVFRHLYHYAPGAAPGTGWGLIQAMTYYTSHEASVRCNGRAARRFSPSLDANEREHQARLESNLWGHGHRLNQQAVEYALALN